MSPEIIQVRLVLQHTICNSVSNLTYNSLRHAPHSQLVVDPFIYLCSIVCQELTLQDHNGAVCMFIALITTVSIGLTHYAMLTEWLISVYL